MDLILVATGLTRRVYTCCFAPEDACFQGHFPGQPVVPGSLIMALSLEAIHKDFAQDKSLTIKRFSFRSFATPGCYELHILLQSAIFFCRFCREQQIFAQGQITCA